MASDKTLALAVLVAAGAGLYLASRGGTPPELPHQGGGSGIPPVLPNINVSLPSLPAPNISVSLPSYNLPVPSGGNVAAAVANPVGTVQNALGQVTGTVQKTARELEADALRAFIRHETAGITDPRDRADMAEGAIARFNLLKNKPGLLADLYAIQPAQQRAREAVTAATGAVKGLADDARNGARDALRQELVDAAKSVGKTLANLYTLPDRALLDRLGLDDLAARLRFN